MKKDITSLRKSEREFRSLIEQGPFVTYFILYEDGKARVSYVSPQIRDFIGYAPEEWMATAALWEKHIHPADKDKIIQKAASCYQKGERFCEEYRMITRKGEVKWIHDESAIIRNDAGVALEVRGSWYDITLLKRAEEPRRVFADLGRNLSVARTSHDVGMVVAQTADAILGWDAFYINMYDKDAGVAYSIINIDTVEGERREFPSIYEKRSKPSPMFLHVLQEGARIILREKPEDAARSSLITFRESPQRSASLMFVPIRERGREIIGLLSIQSYSFKAYNKNDLDILQILADHCSGALERAAAEENLHRAEERATVFALLANQLNSIHTPRDAGLIILETADKLLGWDASNFNLLDPEKYETIAVLNIDTFDGVKKEVPIVGRNLTSMTRRIIREGAQLILRDDESYKPDVELLAFGDTSRRSRSLMFAPVRKGQRVLGTITIQSYSPLAYSKADLQTLQSLADHCAGALERIQAERSLEKERHLLSVMLDNLPQHVYIKDAQSRFLAANRQLWMSLGLKSMKDIIGKTDADFFPSEVAAVALAEERELLQTGEPIRDKSVSYIDASTGRCHWLSNNKIPLKNPEGQITGILGFNIEYTDRKRMEDQQEAFIRLGRLLSAAATPKEAGGIIVDIAQDLIGWDSCFILLYQEEKNYLNTLFTVDTINGERIESPAEHFSGFPSGYTLKAIKEGKQFILREHEEKEPISTLSFGDRSRRSASLMFVPIYSGSKVIGVISIQSYRYNAYTSQDINILESLSHLCAGALVRIRAQEDVRASEERLSLAKKFGRIGVWDKDLHTGVITWSDTTSEIFEIPPGRFDGTRQMFMSMIPPEDHPLLDKAMKACLERGEIYHSEHRIILPSGERRWVAEQGNAIRNEKGEAIRLLGVCIDITDRKRAEEQLARAAFYDSLTDLPNRALFTDRLERCLARSKRRPNYIFAVMLLDLDRFKVVNDSLGHLMGDKLLTEAAKRLRDIVREEDTVARLGGDEFTILLDGIKENSHAIHIAKRVIEELSRSFVIEGNEIFTSASIGILFSSQGYEKIDQIMRDADTALYRAKESGRNRFVVFDREMHEAVAAYLEIETGLRSALYHNEFCLYYQPLASVKSGNLCGWEALIRWRHPRKGLLPPQSFIPISEETGLIVSIGEWVLMEACRQMALWKKTFPKAKNLFASVNISDRQFSSSNLVPCIQGALSRHHLDSGCLHLEISESALFKEHDHIVPILTLLRKNGIRVLLDDFGASFSPFGRLAELPIDFLKIDRSFISRLGKAEESGHIVRSMISLARILNIRVVAEGAETRIQMDALSDMDCEYVQGNFISEPLPPDEFEKFLID
ncbi:EAL domain-containing protein [Candidatus Sumerlaeota bacterium]|nr:EAL domain-containing protein [Candidatus Sumerlaeota bacterium]